MKPNNYIIEQRLMLSIVTALAVLSAGVLAWQAIAPQAVHILGLTIDRLSAVLTLLVATVGAVCLRYSLRYLDGEPGQRRFLWWLTFSVAMAFLLMMATNLVVLFITWSLVSLGLHKLLTHYTDRPEAVPPARKKFLISRLGDVALILAIVLIWQGWGTLDLNAFLAAATPVRMARSPRSPCWWSSPRSPSRPSSRFTAGCRRPWSRRRQCRR